MPTSHMSEVVQYLRQTVLLHEGTGLTDGQLLGCFIEQRDDAAFAALVRRHGPMVWGVCRRLLRHHQDAEDAFQATFLVLLRKAASIVPRTLVANWLYGVAQQTALKARATTAKRRARERQGTPMPQPARAADRWNDLRDLLDQALSRLPDKYRTVLVLCDLEGKTRKEVARQLGCPEGTVASRLATARTLLAKRLAGHGLAVSSGAVAAALAQNVASASVPTSVVSATLKAARLFAAGRAAATGALSVEAVALTEGVLKSMLVNKLVPATAFLVVLVLIYGGGGLSPLRAGAQPGPAPQPTARSGQGQQEPGKAEGTSPQNPTLSNLQGTWVAVSAEAHGTQVPEDKVKEAQVTLVISGDRFTATARGVFTDDGGRKREATLKGVIQLDSTKQPGKFDLVDCRLDAGKLKDVSTNGAAGIYELKGDSLKVCYGPERPTEFKTKPYSYQKLYVFQREKPKK
jgi:RNA polymerase sigma factor (sigma-70 family)